jgi:hypothetical protein
MSPGSLQQIRVGSARLPQAAYEGSIPGAPPAAVAPKRLIPIHTFERTKFPSLFDNVTLADDGQWIDI